MNSYKDVNLQVGVLLFLTLLLSACGGGGDGGDTTASGKVDLPLVVYKADQDIDGMFELYRSDTGAKITPDLVMGGNVRQFALTPNKKSVVYIADQDIDNKFDIYRVDLDTPNVSTRLRTRLTHANADVITFAISPDGSKVVYSADADIDGVPEIYLINIDGTNQKKINGNVGNPPQVSAALYNKNPWSKDGKYIVQYVQKLSNGATVGLNIYDDSLGKANSTRLTPPLVSGGSIVEYEFTPDNTAIIYSATQDASTVRELYRVNLNNPANSIKLNPPLVAGGDVERFVITPNSSAVIYKADQDTDGVNELYRVPFATPTVSAKINPLLPVFTGISSFTLTADGKSVIYSADQTANNIYELYQVKMTSLGNSTKLNGTLTPSGGVLADFSTTPDSSAVIYRADQDTYGQSELYRVVLANPGASTKLNSPLISNRDISFGYIITANNKGVVYLADQDTVGVNELYWVPFATPGSSTKLNGILVPGGEVSDIK